MDQLTPVSPTQQKFFELHSPNLVQPLLRPVTVDMGIAPEATGDQLVAASPTLQVQMQPQMVQLVPVMTQQVSSPIGVAAPAPVVQPAPVEIPPDVPVVTPEPPEPGVPAVQVNPSAVSLVELVVNQAYATDLYRYPTQTFAADPRALLNVQLVITTEIYAEVRMRIAGPGLTKGELTTDQIKYLFSSGELFVAEESAIEMYLMYKDDHSKLVNLTGECGHGTQLVERLKAYADNYIAELDDAGRNNQSDRLMRRFLTVLIKESAVVREWISSFPLSIS